MNQEMRAILIIVAAFFLMIGAIVLIIWRFPALTNSMF